MKVKAMLLIAVLAVTASVVSALMWRYDQAVERTVGDATPRVQTTITTQQKAEDAQSVVLVIGDSYTEGSAMNSGPTWIERLAAEHGWLYLPRANGGAGFIGDMPFSERNLAAGTTSDLVIIAGGRNDIAEPLDKVMRGARKTISDVQKATTGDVVIFSPFTNAFPDYRTYPLREELKKLAKEKGLPFFDATTMFLDHPELIGSDQTHPTDAGHKYLAKKIGAWLRSHGLPRVDAWQGTQTP